MKLGKKLLAICLVLITTISLSISASAVSAKKVSTTHSTGTVIVTKLIVRSGPGKTYKKVGSLMKGSTVTILSRKSGWDKIQHKSHTGYVYSKYLRVK